MEEWISLNEYMRRNKMGYNVVLQMIYNKEIEARKTPGGRYKIKVGGQTVSNEMYEKVVRENSELKTLIRTLQGIANQVTV